MPQPSQVHELHVWEHPSLHVDKRSDLKDPAAPVEIVYDPHEYDWWHRDSLGDLVIGRYETGRVYDESEGKYRQTRREVTTFIIPRGMFAKVEERLIDIAEHVDPVAVNPGNAVAISTGSLPILTPLDVTLVEPSKPAANENDDNTKPPRGGNSAIVDSYVFDNEELPLPQLSVGPTGTQVLPVAHVTGGSPKAWTMRRMIAVITRSTAGKSFVRLKWA